MTAVRWLMAGTSHTLTGAPAAITPEQRKEAGIDAVPEPEGSASSGAASSGAASSGAASPDS